MIWLFGGLVVMGLSLLASIFLPTPWPTPTTTPAPERDWRKTGRAKWTVLKETDDFVVLGGIVHWLDFDSGEERWEPHGRYSPYTLTFYPHEIVVPRSAVDDYMSGNVPLPKLPTL